MEFTFDFPRYLERELGITGLIHDTPLDFLVGDPGLLYPLEPMMELLSGEGMRQVLGFLEQAIGSEHPLYAQVAGLA